jgi:hypothetical protein
MTDRNAAKEVLFRLRLMHPAKTYLNLAVKTVSRPKDASGFVVLPRRWVVERSPAWVMHARPAAHARLRTAHPARGLANHLGRDHPHDRGNHPAILPQEQSAGLPRSPTGLIILKASWS